jgi:hypothetical protein
MWSHIDDLGLLLNIAANLLHVMDDVSAVNPIGELVSDHLGLAESVAYDQIVRSRWEQGQCKKERQGSFIGRPDYNAFYAMNKEFCAALSAGRRIVFLVSVTVRDSGIEATRCPCPTGE